MVAADDRFADIADPECASSATPDVLGYHTGADIPSCWAYAQRFVQQDNTGRSGTRRRRLGAPAAGDLLLQFDHPDIAFGLVVVEGDGEVGREAQYVVLVLIEAAEQGTGGSKFRSPAFPGPWRGWLSAWPSVTRFW